MRDAEGRTPLLRQLLDERQLIARVLFWSLVLAVWAVLRSRWHLKTWRARYGG